jgi:hypothetical protein
VTVLEALHGFVLVVVGLVWLAVIAWAVWLVVRRVGEWAERPATPRPVQQWPPPSRFSVEEANDFEAWENELR